MNKLLKLKEIGAYRFFNQFAWDESNCTTFGTHNVVYGWNGAGKSTLCDLFQEISTGRLGNSQLRLNVLFQDATVQNSSTATHNNISNYASMFKVFHQHYVQETISKVDGIQHIYALGKGQKDKIEELTALESELSTKAQELTAATQMHTQLDRHFETLKSSKAAEIREQTGYAQSKYNKNHFLATYQALIVNCVGVSTISDKDYTEAKIAAKAIPLNSIPAIATEFMPPAVENHIIPILQETPTNRAIEALQKDERLNNWAREGVEIHTEKSLSVCQFCLNSLDQARLVALKDHFNESYKDLTSKITQAKNRLQTRKQEFETVETTLPDAGLFYNELQEEYTRLKSEAIALAKNNASKIDDMIRVLDIKKNDIISDKTEHFQIPLKAFSFDYSVFGDINALIERHRARTSDFENSVDEAQRKIEQYLVTQSLTEVSTAEKSKEESESTLTRLKNEASELKQKINTITGEIKNTKIPAEQINQDISRILGRDELKFITASHGYQIFRHGELAENLSTGEKNAIALIYFFNFLGDMNVNIKESIVVLDDPISSFDSNFYYSTMGYIREKIKDVGQLFIFTHNFSLLKDFKKMLKETRCYLLKRESGAPILVNESKLMSSYHDEYAYLFATIFEFAKNPPEDETDYLPYPNMARRLLEGFLAFKVPDGNEDLLNKVFALEGETTDIGRSMLRLLNNYSHLRYMDDGNVSNGIEDLSALPPILNHLFDFMAKHDKVHYDTLVGKCGR